MASETESLKICIVSTDVKLLHEVAWMLSAVGYTADATTDFEPNALWRRYADFDVLIVDGRSAAAPFEPVLAHDSHNPVYRIVLYDAKTAADIGAWQAAGASDVIAVPVSRGELLTRLRTGGRYLELEHRMLRWSTRSQIPGLFSRRGFIRQLAKLDSTDPAHDSYHTLLFTAIDWYRGVVNKGGQNAGDRVVAATARAIRASAGESAFTAYLGEGRFATLLPRQNEPLAKAIAERIANDFGARESQRDGLGRSTLSTAIVPWNTGETPEELVDSGLKTLTIARQSGGDCILERGQYAQEHATWSTEIAEGNPFASVVAQEIMEYFPAVLTADADEAATIKALRRARVPVCPFVDHEGRLTGVASAEEASDALSSNRLAALPIQKPETIAAAATFAEIYEAFSTRGCSTLVVTVDDRPLGYLTFNGFLSLVEPVGTHTYAGADVAADDSRRLVVPSLSSDCEPA